MTIPLLIVCPEGPYRKASSKAVPWTFPTPKGSLWERDALGMGKTQNSPEGIPLGKTQHSTLKT